MQFHNIGSKTVHLAKAGDTIYYYKVVVKIVAYDWQGRGPGDEGAGN